MRSILCSEPEWSPSPPSSDFCWDSLWYIPVGGTLALLLIAWFATTWLYGALFESLMRGQTPGKRMMQLRVLRTNGTPVGWFEAFGRNLLMGADGWILIGLNPMLGLRLNTVALLSMCATARMQRLGDVLFDTMVVDETREYVRRPAELTASVEAIRRDECSGRYHVPERTLAIMERLFEGDRIIPALRREEIAPPLANALRTRLGWEEPAPDPFNPHPVMEQMPHRHSQFLRRLLKTFAADPASDRYAEQAGAGSDARPLGRSKPVAGRPHGPAERDASAEESIRADSEASSK